MRYEAWSYLNERSQRLKAVMIVTIVVHFTLSHPINSVPPSLLHDANLTELIKHVLMHVCVILGAAYLHQCFPETTSVYGVY